MLDTQTDFDKTVDLLKNNQQNFPQIARLLEQIRTSLVSFQRQEINSPVNDRESVYSRYELEAGLDHNIGVDPYVYGFEELLKRLKSTKHTQICTTYFYTSAFTFIVLSDFQKTELLGVLVSKKTIQDAKNKVGNLKELLKSIGMTSEIQIDDSEIKYQFLQGQLQTNN